MSESGFPDEIVLDYYAIRGRPFNDVTLVLERIRAGAPHIPGNPGYASELARCLLFFFGYDWYTDTQVGILESFIIRTRAGEP